MTEKRVAIFGLGFVGLPLALSFAMKGCIVKGIDIDEKLIADLKKGLTHHLETYKGIPIQEILQKELAAGRFQVSTDPGEAMASCDDIIVTVGIPVNQGIPDLAPLTSVATSIAKGLRPGQLVLMRSTVTPGTTRRVVKPLLEGSGLRAEEDFSLAYAAERIAEGRAFEEFENMPTVVSGIGPRSLERACNLLKIVTQAELFPASSIEIGETAKILENLSRDVAIAFVNECARFTKAMGIDIFEVIKVCNTHKRVKLLQPGPGVGGYCIPNAFYYLLPGASEHHLNLRLAPMARRLNDEVPFQVAGMVLRNLPVPPAQAKIAVLGIAMKDYSNDDRLSPALEVIRTLREAGAKVASFDPAVPKTYPFSVSSLEEALKEAHGIVILARQKSIDYHNLAYFKKLLQPTKPFIVDTRNIYTKKEAAAAGFWLETL